MIAYRCLTSLELKCLIDNDDYCKYYEGCGSNTFKYQEDEKYMHFFLFDDHAEYYKPRMKAATIGIYSVPNEIIDQYGFGMYDCVTTPKNSALFADRMPFPEIIIKRKEYNNNFLLAFSGGFNICGSNSGRSYTNPFDHLFKVNNVEYTYADIYYEIVCRLTQEYHIEPKDVVKYLNMENIRQEIENYFNENYLYFEEQVEMLKHKNVI